MLGSHGHFVKRGGPPHGHGLLRFGAVFNQEGCEFGAQDSWWRSKRANPQSGEGMSDCQGQMDAFFAFPRETRTRPQRDDSHSEETNQFSLVRNDGEGFPDPQRPGEEGSHVGNVVGGILRNVRGRKANERAATQKRLSRAARLRPHSTKGIEALAGRRSKQKPQDIHHGVDRAPSKQGSMERALEIA